VGGHRSCRRRTTPQASISPDWWRRARCSARARPAARSNAGSPVPRRRQTTTTAEVGVSILLLIIGTLAVLAGALARALVVDEIRGYIQRRITASVNATIESLPSDLQQKWADEWRAELGSTISSPLAAARFAIGLRRSSLDLVRTHAALLGHSTEHRDHPNAKGKRPAGVDFSDRRRQAAFQEAAQSMARAYEILSAQLGVSNLRGDMFMRDAAICAKTGLIWKHGIDRHDAIDPDTREPVEIKSTRLREGAPLYFVTSVTSLQALRSSFEPVVTGSSAYSMTPRT
jgi:hypothetical protein